MEGQCRGPEGGREGGEPDAESGVVAGAPAAATAPAPKPLEGLLVEEGLEEITGEKERQRKGKGRAWKGQGQRQRVGPMVSASKFNDMESWRRWMDSELGKLNKLEGFVRLADCGLSRLP